MRTSVILSLAYAVTALAQGFSSSFEPLDSRDLLDLDFDGPAGPDDIVLTERDLDIAEGLVATPVDKRFTPPEIKPVSTSCAAVPRRSLGKNCGVTGKLLHPSKRTIIHNVIFQRCANSCVCRSASNGNCQTFHWVPNPAEGVGRGRCVMWGETLQQMGFVPGLGRTFYSRSCYHKGKPQPTGIQTQGKAVATPPPTKRSIDSGLSDALAGVL